MIHPITFNHMLALALTAFLFLLPLSHQKEGPGIKEQLLSLSKKYFPGNYQVLKEYDEEEIENIAEGDSLEEYIYSVASVVHEGYHQYQSTHSSYFEPGVWYRINDSLSYTVKNFKTFPSIEINTIVAPAIRKKIYRYSDYVGAKEKMLVTQQFGILGLLEEAIAYYQSFSTAVDLFRFFEDHYGWKNPDPWLSYLGNMASYRYSITEFELFMSWYLQCAKANHPATYKEIINNSGFRDLARFLHIASEKLKAKYNENRAVILSHFEGKVAVRGNFIMNEVTGMGKGLYDFEVRDMEELLSAPEHKAYLQLLR